MDTDTRFQHSIWVNVIVCTWLLVVTFALSGASNRVVQWNEAVAALVAALCSVASMRRHAHHGTLRIIVFATGAWLAVSALYLGYPAARSGADVLFGGLIMIVTAIEMAQASSHQLT